jgi:DNA repair protein RadD
MTAPLRDYQETAVCHVFWAFHQGFRRVCVVSPTGSGKTRIGVELATRFAGRKGLWLAHRTELIKQAAERLREAGLKVGIISPEFDPNPEAPVQVASLDTLAARGERPEADWVAIDECHHAPAHTYSTVLAHYQTSWIFGLTATPERADGKPLGGQFDYMFAAANYSDLLAAGHIAPCKVITPAKAMNGGLAQCPLVAYQALTQELGEHPLTFAFAKNVRAATAYADAFNAAGVSAGVVTGKTSPAVRADLIKKFSNGEIRVLWNVNVLTEGTDVPAARVCLLARGVGHAGTFLQMAGRVLRIHESKPRAFLVDLAGVSLKHGSPTIDREYSLNGRAIAPKKKAERKARKPRIARQTEIQQARLYELPENFRPLAVRPRRRHVDRQVQQQAAPRQLRNVHAGPAPSRFLSSIRQGLVALFG